MTRRFGGILLLVLMLVLSGCGGKVPSTSPEEDPSIEASSVPAPTNALPAESPTEPPVQPGAEADITTFSVVPVEGWMETVSTDTFKSYNLLEPYVGSANFWIRYCGSNVFSGEEQDVKAFLEAVGFSDYELVSIDKLDYEMPTVRCVTQNTISGMNFTLGHYIIDVPGEQDIYFQLSTAPENYADTQPLWEDALKTLKAE